MGRTGHTGSTRLLLVRHGESAWNAERRIQGQADPPLSSHGGRQALALATALRTRRLAAIYDSGLRRASETAACVGATQGLAPRAVAALREVDLGAWQGWIAADLPPIERARYDAWHGDPMAVCPPAGEALSAALHRVAPAVDEIVTAHVGEAVLLVTHSIIGRVALCHLLGVGLELVPRFKLKMASISLVRVSRGVAVLERLGDTSHLAAPDGGGLS